MTVCAGSSTLEQSAIQPKDGGSIPTSALQLRKSPRVEKISLKAANTLLEKFHYLGAVRTASHAFGHSEGATVWGVQRSRTWADTLRKARFNPLELIRMVGIEGHKWATSSLLSHSLREIFKLRLADVVVTYADPMAGHTGAVYLAANWQRLDSDAQPDGFVWRLDGKTVSRKRFYAELGTSAISAARKKYGDRISFEADVPKRRFFYLANSARLNEFLDASRKKKTWGVKRTNNFNAGRAVI